MKFLTIFITFFSWSTAFTQIIDTTLVQFRGTDFYLISSNNNSNVLIFLHGGINNPVFNNSSTALQIELLLENNHSLIPVALKNGFDLVIPQTNDSMNWLSNHQYCHEMIFAFLDSVNLYDKSFLSGFSDGGTGSYKMFYDNSDDYDGLLVFNGYPQHENFYQTVNYSNITDKRIFFLSTFSDKTIPYEFLLTEYCRQKTANSNTYLYVKEGAHSFKEYGIKEFELCFEVMVTKTGCTQNEPIHAFIKDDQVVEFYPFRKKVTKKYGYGEEFYLQNLEQRQQLK